MARRRGRYLRGVLGGTGCRLAVAGRSPVGDDVLADRVRSRPGPVRKRLDVPRVHVMVTGHVVTLQGEVGTLGEVIT